MDEHYLGLWNKLCNDVSIQKASRLPESKFQVLLEDLFAALGWVRFIGEIDPQRTIPIGAANQIKPDIIIKSGDVDLFVVELKRPSADSTERHASQLKSYMLQMKLSLGVYFGENCQVFFDDPEDNALPERIATIDFTPDNKEGLELLNLLSKGVFTPESAREYYDIKIAEVKNKERAEVIIKQLVSNEGKDLASSLLLESLTEQHGPAVASIAMEEIELVLRRKHLSHTLQNDICSPRQTTSGDSKPKTKRAVESRGASSDSLSELKIGKIAQTLLREALESGKASSEEIDKLKRKDYSKEAFGIDYPLLVSISEEHDPARYYSTPLAIDGEKYYLCSQWFEVPQNNDRPYLLAWLNDHGICVSGG